MSRVIEHQDKSGGGGTGARRRRQLAEGECVWCRDYRSNDKWLPGKISEKIGNTDYRIRCDNGTEVHRHVDQLRRRISDVSAGIRTPPVKPNRRASTLIFPVDESSCSGGYIGGGSSRVYARAGGGVAGASSCRSRIATRPRGFTQCAGKQVSCVTYDC